MRTNRIAVMHSVIGAHAAEDEQDTLVQVRAVSEVLVSIGFEALPVVFSLDVPSSLDLIRHADPYLVFNLIESLEGSGRLIHVAPSFLEFLGIPYTGCPAEALMTTSNKLVSKRLLSAAGIRVPAWQTCGSAITEGLRFAPPGILKSVWEHASIGMNDTSVFRSVEELHHLTRTITPQCREGMFVEEFIEGREFNIGLLGGRDPRPQVLPPAEMLFKDFPRGKPTIVGYRAKWERDSFEYTHTVRKFDFLPEDDPLLRDLLDQSLACWDLFGLRGYARIDFRVDGAGIPWVLEVNANPCISPDAGFVAAAGRAGISFEEIVSRIVQDASKRCEEQ